MKKIIHYDPEEAGRLHCDECGYDLECKQPFTANLIGTPCPECGANMLTRQDYERTIKMFAAVDWINRWFGWLFGTETPPKDALKVWVKNHNGETIIRRKDQGE
jgi:predicted RNA-binding Zn-ribbon protein involved in translation (DUF1610 family)